MMMMDDDDDGAVDDDDDDEDHEYDDDFVVSCSAVSIRHPRMQVAGVVHHWRHSISKTFTLCSHLS